VSEKLATDSLNPSALKREFVSILHLLEEKNFRGVKINLTQVLEWTRTMTTTANATEKICGVSPTKRVASKASTNGLVLFLWLLQSSR
jgi:hypothetical protein